MLLRSMTPKTAQTMKLSIKDFFIFCAAKNTTFNISSLYAERDCYYYLLLDSDILGNIVVLIHKEDSEIRHYKLSSTHKEPLIVTVTE